MSHLFSAADALSHGMNARGGIGLVEPLFWSYLDGSGSLKKTVSVSRHNRWYSSRETGVTPMRTIRVVTHCFAFVRVIIDPNDECAALIANMFVRNASPSIIAFGMGYSNASDATAKEPFLLCPDNGTNPSSDFSSLSAFFSSSIPCRFSKDTDFFTWLASFVSYINVKSSESNEYPGMMTMFVLVKFSSSEINDLRSFFLFSPSLLASSFV
mmetsp:Transcript_7703/g.19068  ORF Transcript_7703/g.19068 Transcript_7703/m.19068 type:complete len:212 (+) Transcript_7703:3775-4410(+)